MQPISTSTPPRLGLGFLGFYFFLGCNTINANNQAKEALIYSEALLFATNHTTTQEK